MKAWLRGFYYSFPIQLVFLHFRKYQVLLVFWFILFSTVQGIFMQNFGADSLYLYPEYMGTVNAAGSAIVGIAVGMFIMSWNITSFILFSRNFNFLAATTNPFLKFCINNSIIPLSFLIFYFYHAYEFNKYKELLDNKGILLLTGGFLLGLILILTASFAYFFGADRTIFRRLLPILNNPKEYITHLRPDYHELQGEGLIRVEWYLNTPFTVHKARNVSHYTQQFIDTVLKRHHFAAVISVFIAFLFLIGIGFFLEIKLFQIPAAASITIFFAILIGVSGAFAYFLQTWSIPYLIGLILLLNFFYKMDWIDPRNKAYGLNYSNKTERPEYNRESLLTYCDESSISADSLNMIGILENWKRKQGTDKPVFTLLTVSGGGNRSATFVTSTLQYLDSLTRGKVMDNVFLVTGSSGGMIGAAYFRELFLQRKNGEPVHLQDRRYVNNIAGDLLNPVFSSFVARDIISPAHKFRVGPYEYVKDRAYAFEYKLNENTQGVLDKQLKDYRANELKADIPLLFFCSVITRDGRKLITSTQPVRFMMQPRQDTADLPYMDPDAIDFISFFAKQDPLNLRVLTALRMNATFPVVLPSVWLPSDPVIDVMDAGLRDNYGEETALRFLSFFNDWIAENTGGVLMIQIRDRVTGAWDHPYESNEISDHATKPFLLLQHNWDKMMQYSQNDMISYYNQSVIPAFTKVNIIYNSENEESKAALNFHLTQREKNDIISSVNAAYNREAFQKIESLLGRQDTLLLKQAE